MLLPRFLCYPTLSWRNRGGEILSCLETIPQEVLKSLLLFCSPELIRTAKNPNISKASLGGMGRSYSVLVYQVTCEDLRPLEEQWVALPAPAWQQAVENQCCAWRGTGHRKPCPGSRSCCAVLGKAQSAARDSELCPLWTLMDRVLSESTTASETLFSWSYNLVYRIQHCFSQIKFKSELPCLK